MLYNSPVHMCCACVRVCVCVCMCVFEPITFAVPFSRIPCIANLGVLSLVTVDRLCLW